jgi:hypothetical protein
MIGEQDEYSGQHGGSLRRGAATKSWDELFSDEGAEAFSKIIDEMRGCPGSTGICT